MSERSGDAVSFRKVVKMGPRWVCAGCLDGRVGVGATIEEVL